MKPRRTTSSCPNREKMRRNSFGRRNNRPTSLRHLYIPGHMSKGKAGLRVEEPPV